MNKYKLTNKDILKYFAQYLGCDILIYDGGDPVSATLEGIDFVSEKVIAERTNYDPSQIKLHLKDAGIVSCNHIDMTLSVFIVESGFCLPYMKIRDEGIILLTTTDLVNEGLVELKK